MKGWVDDRADDEERQKGREYERRKALKERGRDREVSSGFFFWRLTFHLLQLFSPSWLRLTD